MTYVAVAAARTSAGWTGREVDLGEVDDVDELADLLRDHAEDDEPVLLLVEENDEYVGLLRVDGDGDPRVFLSDLRSAATSEIAALLAEVAGEVPAVEEEGSRPVSQPTGDAGLLGDVGTSSDRLLQLCAEEGLLPGDVIAAVAEHAGFLDVLEEVRGG